MKQDCKQKARGWFSQSKMCLKHSKPTLERESRTTSQDERKEAVKAEYWKFETAFEHKALNGQGCSGAETNDTLVYSVALS